MSTSLKNIIHPTTNPRNSTITLGNTLGYPWTFRHSAHPSTKTPPTTHLFSGRSRLLDICSRLGSNMFFPDSLNVAFSLQGVTSLQFQLFQTIQYKHALGLQVQQPKHQEHIVIPFILNNSLCDILRLWLFRCFEAVSFSNSIQSLAHSNTNHPLRTNT